MVSVLGGAPTCASIQCATFWGQVLFENGPACVKAVLLLLVLHPVKPLYDMIASIISSVCVLYICT